MKPRFRLFAIVAWGSLLLPTCSDELQSPTRESHTGPTVDVLPDTLAFTIPGDSLLSDMSVVKTIEIRYSGSDSLQWTASENLAWLTLSPVSGVIAGHPASVEAQARYDLIGDGKSLSGDVIIATDAEVDTVHVVARNNTVRMICAAESTMVFTADGGVIPYRTLRIRACGNAETEWTAASHRSWMSVFPTAGTSNGEWIDLQVRVAWEELARPGPYSGPVTLHAPANEVRIDVQAWWPLCADRASIELAEDTDPGPTALNVFNCGPHESVDWTASADKSWVMISPESGTSFGEGDAVDVAVDWTFDFTTVTTEAYRKAEITFAGAGDTLRIPLTVQPACRFVFTEPSAETEWTAGTVQTVRWRRVSTAYYAGLVLYKGNQKVYDLQTTPYGTVTNSGVHEWLVTTEGYPSGSDYRFRITNDPCCDCGAWSDYFTITVPACHISVTQPDLYSYYWIDSRSAIRWVTHAPAANVSIDLYAHDDFICNIVPSTPNDGLYQWDVDNCGVSAHAYQIKVTDTADPTCTGFSQPFYVFRYPF